VIDTHCHLDMPRFDADRDAVLSRAWAAGVTGLIIPGVAPERWEQLLSWPSIDARIQVGLGIHPQAIPELDEKDDEHHLALLDVLLARGVAIAVGECGLDGPTSKPAPREESADATSSTRPRPSMERQVHLLRAHFALARKHRLPLLVHCLRAHPELLAVLKDEPVPEAGLLLHSYSGSAELTKKYVRYGCHFSFAGPVTFADARRPLDALRSVPLERLLVETDAPDQAPHPFRGSRCEPAHLGLNVEAMAAALGVERAALAERLLENTHRLFPRFSPSEGAGGAALSPSRNAL
jgi:TatD DNase family protein